MSPVIKLNELHLGHSANIIAMKDNVHSERLAELGFYDGACVKPLFRGIFGQPTAFMVQNAVIALRPGESEKILVNELP